MIMIGLASKPQDVSLCRNNNNNDGNLHHHLSITNRLFHIIIDKPFLKSNPQNESLDKYGDLSVVRQ